MFAQGYSALMQRIRPDAIPIPRPTGSRAARVESDVARAMSRELGWIKLSERLRDPAAYRRLQSARRETLEALLFAEPTKAAAQRVADLIAMLCEELNWSGAAFDDAAHPVIDLACAETAVLLGWTRRILGDGLSELSPLLVGQLQSEVRRRVFTPLLAHDDYPFLNGNGAYPLTICADLLLAAFLLETDESRLSRLMKRLLRALDENCARHGRRLTPLAERVTDSVAATDLVGLLRRATRGEFDPTAQIPSGDWLDEILFAWIQDDLFVDPAGNGFSPALSGGDVFRLGLSAEDTALTALGAQLFRQKHLPSPTVTGRLLEAASCKMLEAEDGRPPKLRYAATQRNLLMTTRMSGLYCALHIGGDRGNAGDLVLFASGRPILTDGGRDCPAHNLPVLAGRTQLAQPEPPCAADFEAQEDRETLSVELTHAYPVECGLRSYQRTVLTLRNEQILRVVDALSFDQPTVAAFSFVTPIRPESDGPDVLLGPVRMSWEGEFRCVVRSLQSGLYQLEMTTLDPVTQALFAFNFEHL